MKNVGVYITNPSLTFKLTLSFKDNKMRIEANSFIINGRSGRIFSHPLEQFEVTKLYYKVANDNIDDALSSFFKNVEKIPFTKDDKW